MSISEDVFTRTDGAEAGVLGDGASRARSDHPEQAPPSSKSPGGREGGIGSLADEFLRNPSLAIPRPGKPPIRLATDRVRARPAISPPVSMMIGMTAMGLGVWGTCFPRSVQKTLGVKASPAVIRTAFGAREFVSGVMLGSDPTRAGVLWARVAADMFDIAVLRSLDSDENPRRGAARAALGFVLGVTALDVVTAARMSTVRRNCA